MDHLRLELTIFDSKLFREKAVWTTDSRPTLLFCTRYEDAVSQPFPVEGKAGLSVWVGSLEAFKDPKTRLLWELEKRRKRPRMVVLTGQKGRSFMRAYREVGTILSDTSIVPASFLRRSGKGWDSLDFFSAGDSPFMEGANPRLKRLKQYGWEYMVDGVCLIDPAVKTEYFDGLRVSRETLQSSAATGFAQMKLSPLVGVAGEGLSKESLFSLLEEPLLQGLFAEVKGQEMPPEGEWLLLTHSQGGNELTLWGHKVAPLRSGEVLSGVSEQKKGRAEFAVASVAQSLSSEHDSSEKSSYCRVKVDWRYPPGREIPTRWIQKSASPAG